VPDGFENILLETWASIEQLKASRSAENFQEQINAVYELKMRKRSVFEPRSNQSVKWRGEYYSIVQIVEDVADKMYWLITIAGRGTGLQD